MRLFPSIRLRGKSPFNSQRGFALTEVLIASAILSMVAVATVSAISTSLRLSERNHKGHMALYEAENIVARLHASLSPDELFMGYVGWQIQYEAVNGSAPSRKTDLIPVTATIYHSDLAGDKIDIILMMTQEELEARS